MTELINPFFQKVFVVKETTPGTLIFPTSANCVIGAGHIECEQGTSYSDSPEIRPSLNLRDQVRDKNSPGTWKLPILVRPNGVDATTDFEIENPMGDVFFECLQGKKTSWSAEIGAAGIDSSVTTIPFENFSGDANIPAYGVLKVTNGTSNKELIYYTGITWTDTTSGNFTGCTRAWGGTTAEAAVQTDAIVNASPSYTQAIDRSSFSLWYEQDGIVYYASGATVSDLSLSLSNKGYPQFDLSGGFIGKGRAGKATVASVSYGTESTITLNAGEAKYFSTGARIYNITDADDNSGSGYEITKVDVSGNTITVAEDVSGTWGSSDQVGGYLPADSAIGTPLRAEDSQVTIGGLAKKPTEMSVTVNAAIQYVESEITPDEISDYAASKREVGGSVTQLFKNSELALFSDAEQEDNKKSILIRLGDGTAGATCYLWMKRCSLQVPKLTVSEPLVNIAMEFKALDQDVEDSFAMVFV